MGVKLLGYLGAWIGWRGAVWAGIGFTLAWVLAPHPPAALESRTDVSAKATTTRTIRVKGGTIEYVPIRPPVAGEKESPDNRSRLVVKGEEIEWSDTWTGEMKTVTQTVPAPSSRWVLGVGPSVQVYPGVTEYGVTLEPGRVWSSGGLLVPMEVHSATPQRVATYRVRIGVRYLF